MDFLVAYDGSPLAKTALSRTTVFADGETDTVTVVSVIPRRNVHHAREMGWLGPDEPWDQDRVVDALRAPAMEIAPDATFEFEIVDKFAPRGKIGRALRTFAEREAIDVLVVGSENAGRVVNTLSSLSQSVSFGRYDLYIVRSPDDRFA